jgi:hypothetical protein
LLNEQEQLFSKEEIEALLQQYDILTSKKLTLNFSYAYGFQENHAPEDLDAACRIISTLYPDFYPLFARRLQEKHTYFGNIMICRKPLFDEYCSFLFPIFEQMHPLLHLDTYDDYHKRLYGFLSEFLLMVWCEYKHLKVKECKVGLVGEKKETTEVVHRLWDLLHQQQIAEAKNYFLQMREKRPDILMEASDIHGHLHLCLQAISTCEYEQAYLGHIVLPLHRYGLDLMHYLQECNTAILCFGAGQQEPCHIATLKDPALSDYAIAIAIRLYCPDPAEQKRVSEAISKQCQRVLPL